MKSVSKNKKEVLVFTHAAGNSELGPNGRWSRFAEGLAKFDTGTTIVGSSFFHKYRKLVNAAFLKPASSSVDGASFIHLWSPVYGSGLMRVLNQFIFSLSILFMKRKDFISHNYDIVVASSPHPFVVIGALFWAKKYNAKFVYESRDLWPMLLIQHTGISRLNPYVILCKTMERFAVKNSDFILTPKEFEINYYREKYSFNEVYWIPNTSKSTINRIKKKRESKPFSIIYSGSLQSIYNVEQIISAVRNLPESSLSLKILGDGPELSSLKKFADSDPRIEFSGWLSGDTYDKALEGADVCFFSTSDMDINKYGFSSNKISDYLSRGKPILAHVSQGASGLVSSNSALQSNPGDINTLAENIELLLFNPQIIDVMSSAARKYYKEFYEYDNVLAKLANLIRR